MTLDQLLYLAEIANSHSISAASSKLFISQQALSASVKTLEDELGVQLLERLSTGSVLTKDGLYVASVAKQMLALQNELLDHYHISPFKTEGLSGSLTVATNWSSRSIFLPKVVSHFYKRYPQVDLILQTLGASSDIIAAVENQQADLGLISRLSLDKVMQDTLPETLRFTSYFENRYVCAVHSSSPLAHYQSLSMRTLLKQPLIVISFDGLTENLPLKAIQYYGEPSLIIAESLILAHQMLEDGLGSMLVPPYEAQHLAEKVPNINILQIKEQIRIYHGYVARADQPLTELARRFIKTVDYFKEQSLARI